MSVRWFTAALVAATAFVSASQAARTDTVRLEVSVAGPGRVTSKDGQISCPKSCSGKYDAKSELTLKANPDDGASFEGWSGCDDADGTTCRMTLTDDRSVQAEFKDAPKSETYSLTVSAEGPGRVTSADGKISCPGNCSAKYEANADVVLSAVPDQGAAFSTWKSCDDATGLVCKVSMTSDRPLAAVFAVAPAPFPGPPEIRITSPNAGAFFNRPEDLQVTVAVSVRSSPTFFCLSVDSSTPPDPCDQPAGGNGTNSFTRAPGGVHAGRNTVTAWAVDSRGQRASDRRTFEVASSASGIDIRLQAMDVTQGVQYWGQPRLQVGTDGSRSAIYNGVRLAAGGRTVVRAFADVPSLGAARSITGVRAMLVGWSSGGRLLPGSPLTPIFLPASLRFHGRDELTVAERVSPSAAYTFDLPESWTHGTIMLMATVNAPGSAPRIPECCTANNSYVLSRIRFYDVDPLEITPLEVIWRPPGGVSYTRPGPYLDAYREALNIYPRPIRLHTYRATVDVSAAYARNPSLTTPAIRERAEMDALDAIADMFDVVGKPGYGMGVSRGWVSGMTAWYLRHGSIGSADAARRWTSVAHEFGHQVGWGHASAACGGGDNGQPGEDWPPDQRGYLEGFALDRRPGSGGPAGPYALYGNGFYYDFMSYCAGEGNAWLSVYNWQRLLGGPNRQPDQEAFRTLAWRAVGPTLRVVARVHGDAAEIIRVEPASGSQTPPGDGRYEIVARNAEGAVLSRTSVLPRALSEGGGILLVAEVPAAGAASVEVAVDGVTKASRRASAHEPTVRILSPAPGSTVGKSGNVPVRWAVADADGGAHTATIEYSMDGGRSWTGVGSTAAEELSLPAFYFSASKTAHVRVTVNDGFASGSATSGAFTSAGAPPVVSILRPGPRGESIGADGLLQLAGQAYEDTGKLVGPGSLRWVDGVRVLGHGPSVEVQALSPGRHMVKLLARDAEGRTGSTSVLVRVRAVAPYFLRLTAPRQLSRVARSVRLLVSSSLVAKMRVGGKRFTVDRRLRPVVVPIRPGRSALRLRVLLVAGGRTTGATVTIARR